MDHTSSKPRYSLRASDQGTKRRRHFWFREEIRREIKKRIRDKRPISWSEVLKDDPELAQAGNNHYRSWGKALLDAGKNTKSVRAGRGPKKWTAEAVRADIVRRNANDEDLSPAAMLRTGSYQAVQRWGFYEKNWRKAVEAAGVNYELVVTRKKTDLRSGALYPTSTSVVTEIRRLKTLVPLNPGASRNPNALKSKYPALVRSGIKLFGTWPKAVTAAGIDYSAYTFCGPTRSVIYTKLPANWISLDEKINGHSHTSRWHFFGAKDPGFERVEHMLALRAIFHQDQIGSDASTLLQQVLGGEDITDAECEFLASTIRARPDLLEMLAMA